MVTWLSVINIVKVGANQRFGRLHKWLFGSLSRDANGKKFHLCSRIIYGVELQANREEYESEQPVSAGT